jgi:hypothetical protein
MIAPRSSLECCPFWSAAVLCSAAFVFSFFWFPNINRSKEANPGEKKRQSKATAALQERQKSILDFND